MMRWRGCPYVSFQAATGIEGVEGWWSLSIANSTSVLRQGDPDPLSRTRSLRDFRSRCATDRSLENAEAGSGGLPAPSPSATG